MKSLTGKQVIDEKTSEAGKIEWERKDAKAQKIIITSVDRKPLLHIMNSKTSKDMFDKICMIYERDSEHQKCTLLEEFFSSDIAANIS